MSRDRTKPHIALHGAWWRCSSCESVMSRLVRWPALPFWYVGEGSTPAEAYKNWEKVKHGT